MSDRKKPWSMSDVETIRNGTGKPDLREADPKGLTLPTFALLETSTTVERLAAELLAPPPEGEQPDRMAQLLEMLTAISEAQVRLEAKVDAIAKAVSSPGASKPPASRSNSPTGRRQAASAS